MYTMRKINIRTLRQNLATELGELPFLIERRGEVIAEVNVYTPESSVHKEEPSVHKEEITFKDLRDKPMSPEWKEIKSKEDVIKEVPFKMPHKFGGMKK